MDIPPYQSANTPKNYDSQATRRLLLKKKEIAYLNGKSNEAGLTLISLGIYTKKGFLKLAFAIGRGLKKYDKRERIKEKEVKRKIDREIKGF
ncbi:MAG: hypothetical protein CO014_02275 [Candidatus Tagabacteria bacterium CG_4_8_14_3_um_filter_41_8]|nr:MAG: hypothetical protein CO014_02275 [Candidatus Tagabacteria bacterium CG_4_8_14_3_um_filter_41_8]